MTERPLVHGYTNESWVNDGLVVKQYRNADAAERLQTETAALRRVAGVVPVPAVVDVDLDRTRVTFGFVPGRHGQELIDEGHAAHVLQAAGRTLRQLQEQVPGLVHGDYGPQNLLLDPGALEVAAVLDWEFSHDGSPVEDVAWAEWIVRMHHPGAVRHLPALFDGYGHRPAWSLRHGAMQDGCARLREVCLRRGNQAAADMWRTRQELTRSWRG